MNTEYNTGPITASILQINELNKFKNKKRALFETLTDREKEVLKYTAKGDSNPLIAKKMGISRTTVQNYRANIRRKLLISKDIEYFKYALAFELITFFEYYSTS